MKFIPNTNNKYQFDENGNVFSFQRSWNGRPISLHNGKYSIMFTDGQRNIRKQALINMYKMLEMELKTIPNCSNYSISENGYTYSHITNCEVKYFQDKDGYYRTSLVCDDGIRRKFRRCRLVAMTYIPNPNNKLFVNHIDENKQNDDMVNLEWVTSQENTLHSKTWLKRNRDKLGRFI
ncbi:MAG: HNH endonuclease [Lachnospiraceae bacterium]|nr:HNH endonuclease [Lachnospiraceae bacterium]